MGLLSVRRMTKNGTVPPKSVRVTTVVSALKRTDIYVPSKAFFNSKDRSLKYSFEYGLKTLSWLTHQGFKT